MNYLYRLRRYSEQCKTKPTMEAFDEVYGEPFSSALARHRSDETEASRELLRLTDHTPIDEAWLVTIKNLDGESVRLRRTKAVFFKLEHLDTFDCWHVEAQTYHKGDGVTDLRTCVTTRGELRSLAQLLKIELKEQE